MDRRCCLYVGVSVCLRVHLTRSVAVKYNSCYAQPATSASIKRCNKTYHMEKELTARTSDDVCRYASVSPVPFSVSDSVCLSACLSMAFTPQLTRTCPLLRSLSGSLWLQLMLVLSDVFALLYHLNSMLNSMLASNF